LQPNPEKTSCRGFRGTQNRTRALVFLLIREYAFIDGGPRSLIVQKVLALMVAENGSHCICMQNKGREKVS